ncbi:MAG: Gfo/Idh/MocA family oxidoreductase [Phycisphaeraceae bacterium]
MSESKKIGSKSISRRKFVQGAAAASAAIALPTFIPASALGKEAGVAAPSNRLNLGFIGIGKQSSGHLNSFAGKSDIQVVGVCDVYKPRLEKARDSVVEKYKKLERTGTPEAFEDYRQLLARKDIDAVVIGTPDHWHTAIIVEAAKAKKDIYCEKPLTLTIGEAKLAVDAVTKHGVVFQTGSQQRSDGPFHRACEYIRSGRLGKIKEVHVGIGTTSKPCDLPTQDIPEGLNWDFWQGQSPDRGYNEVLCRKGLPNEYPFNPGWRDYREYSGGHVTDWGAHHFDITQWALGMDGSGPNEIIPPEKSDDVYNASFIYAKTPVGDNIKVTHTKMENGIRFFGELGELFVNRGKIESKPDTILKEPLTDKDVKLEKTSGHRENWLECIKSRKLPICNVAIGAGSVTICHLVNLAYWHNRKLKWDPTKWEFPDDAEANGWRDRARREKYDLPAIG